MRPLASASLLITGLLAFGCASGPDTPPPLENQEPAAPAPKPRAKTSQAQPAPARTPSPILVRGYIQTIDPIADAQEYRCFIKVAEVLRGLYPETDLVTNLSTPKQCFPWVANNEYEGSEVFVHISQRQGQYFTAGFSRTATGVFYPWR